ncbi:integrase/recombinase xerD homolog [Lithobates pipiens]
MAAAATRSGARGRTDDGERATTSSGRSAAAGVEPPSGLTAPLLPTAGERSEGELSGSEEEIRDGVAAAGASGEAADGSRPRQPVAEVSGLGAGSGRRGGPLPGAALDHCFGIAAGWIRRSVSESTWSAYSRVWGEWLEFLRLADAELGDVGADSGLLVLYFVVRQMEGLGSVSGIERKLAALAFWFKLRGEMDATKGFWVRQALKGYRKGNQKKDGRRPVTFAILGVISRQLGGLCTSGYEAHLFRTAFSLAFFGAFRVGELVSPAKTVGGGLLGQDVTVGDGYLCLKLRRSKTDQSGKGVDVWLYALPGSEICPVAAVTEFVKMRPQGEGPLLVHRDGSFLSKFQFITVFRKCLKAGGFDGAQFASHSFRIGAATEAARCGLDETAVKRIGRWESKRFRSYVRPHLV